MIRRHALLLVTVLAMLVMGGCAVAPYWVSAGVALACLVGFIAGMIYLARRPISVEDLHCSAVDIQLDRERDQRLRRARTNGGRA